MQTAIDYLVKNTPLSKNDFYKEVIDNAIKLEREQIEKAFEEGMFHHVNGCCPDEYYEETFEDNKIEGDFSTLKSKLNELKQK